jgi:diguanylate cyclase (GGDEF)-like protein/PAS domain S-box-containing protein
VSALRSCLPGPALQTLVKLATRICGMPMGAVNLIDEERPWQVTAVGTEPEDAPREASYCEVTVEQREPLVVSDARVDPRFADRAFTTGERGSLRSYAGAQLTTPDGHNLGALCVFAEEVHDISPVQVQMLTLLADQAMALLEARHQAVLLAEAEQRFRLAFWTAPIGMALGGLDGRFLQVNPAICDLVGYDEDALLAMSFTELTHRDDLAEEEKLQAEVVAGERASYRLEKRYLHRDGHEVWVELWAALVRDPGGVPQHFVKQVEDITVRKQVERGLIHQAMHDPLTGLPNRLLLLDRLEQAAAVQHRGGCLTVLSLDLDHFKEVNDTHGHAAGDALLVAVAERLRSSLRPEDTIARMGGDEFVIVSHALHADLEEIEALAQRLSDAVAQPIGLEGATVQVGVSIGGMVVTTTAVPESVDELLKGSDQALYRAKRAGRGTTELVRWNPSV